MVSGSHKLEDSKNYLGSIPIKTVLQYNIEEVDLEIRD